MKNMNKSKMLDLSLIIILTLLYVASLIFLLKLDSIPFKWRVAVIAIFTLIYLIFLAFSFKKIKGKKIWIRRVAMVIFCIIYGYTALYSYKGSNMVVRITETNKEKFYSILLVTKTDNNKIETVSDLKGKKVGIQSGLDTENAEYAQDELDKEVSNIEYVESESYVDLKEKLDSGDIDAYLISTSYLNAIEDEHNGYKDTIKTIETYKRTITTNTEKGSEKDLTKEPFTVFVSGVDTSDSGEASTRSDVNMILIVNPLTNHVEMVSFPRDSYVPNLALGGGSDKLTHLSNNGVENSLNSLEAIVGFELDFYVQVNFTSVVEIVDAIGGVEVDVDVEFTEQNSERSFAEEDLIHLEPGVQTLNGEEALAFSRNRHDRLDGDVGRTKAQQDVIIAMVNRMLTAEGAVRAPALLDIIPKYVETNASYDQISELINYELDNMAPWTFGTTTLDNGDFYDLVNASMGNMIASTYVMDRSDLELLYYKYQTVMNPTTFSDFSFDLDNLYADLDDYEDPTDVTMVFNGDDLSPYGGYSSGDDYDYDDNYTDDTTPVQDEQTIPDNDEVTVPDVNNNSTPNGTDGTDGNSENSDGGSGTDDNSGATDDGIQQPEGTSGDVTTP
ncbi:LCP family protein [Breznakia pachnodae]|uniref:LCP family protein required for cell wall assembly n=1 Tax=Breznakia pachnodae TaxID=265178 RepID=A0ABU0E7B3_9FIRM|nr:LCP family protein [Breznakia pachnodae]MDQ0362791.1 LCP family protein required for cell wall assembly [Breznakia pachnodae]